MHSRFNIALSSNEFASEGSFSVTTGNASSSCVMKLKAVSLKVKESLKSTVATVKVLQKTVLTLSAGNKSLRKGHAATKRDNGELNDKNPLSADNRAATSKETESWTNESEESQIKIRPHCTLSLPHRFLVGPSPGLLSLISPQFPVYPILSVIVLKRPRAWWSRKAWHRAISERIDRNFTSTVRILIWPIIS